MLLPLFVFTIWFCIVWKAYSACLVTERRNAMNYVLLIRCNQFIACAMFEVVSHIENCIGHCWITIQLQVQLHSKECPLIVFVGEDELKPSGNWVKEEIWRWRVKNQFSNYDWGRAQVCLYNYEWNQWQVMTKMLWGKIDPVQRMLSRQKFRLWFETGDGTVLPIPYPLLLWQDTTKWTSEYACIPSASFLSFELY